jgi:hypothetical protein
MTFSVAGSAAASERLAGLGALRPERPAPERARQRPDATTGTPAAEKLALPRLERATHFLIHQLLAEAPELGAASPSRPRTLAAYRAQLGQRIRYSGPVTPVDLRI